MPWRSCCPYASARATCWTRLSRRCSCSGSDTTCTCSQVRWRALHALAGQRWRGAAASDSARVLSEAQAALEARAGDAAVRDAARAALEAARACYAPYTHSASGAAVITGSGAIFR